MTFAMTSTNPMRTAEYLEVAHDDGRPLKRTSKKPTMVFLSLVSLCCGVLMGVGVASTLLSAQRSDHCDIVPLVGRPRVVVVTAMVSEMERWVDRLPLGDELAFEAGASRQTLKWNASLRVLGLVTGEGLRRASISVTALGNDDRFDVSESYWIFAGIAGVAPAVGSIGSAFWAQAVVHGDAGYMFDAREIPASFNGTTIVPSDRSEPFGSPAPSDEEADGMVYDISRLANYAYSLTRDINLTDTPALVVSRAGYVGPAAEPPSVALGNTGSGNLFWAGDYMTEWATRWHDYWLQGRGVGQFATTAMEDTAVLEALVALTRVSLANASRTLILRTASDYSAAPPGVDLVDWFYSGRHYASDAAFEAAYVVGAPVIVDLLRHDPPL